jgi:hypothetical protein
MIFRAFFTLLGATAALAYSIWLTGAASVLVAIAGFYSFSIAFNAVAPKGQEITCFESFCFVYICSLLLNGARK